MKADWLLMRDVRDELTKLRSRSIELTGNTAAYERVLRDIWESICDTIEDTRDLNGGAKRRSLRTKPEFKLELNATEWLREMKAKNYVGRPLFDILVNRVAIQKVEKWKERLR